MIALKPFIEKFKLLSFSVDRNYPKIIHRVLFEMRTFLLATIICISNESTSKKEVQKRNSRIQKPFNISKFIEKLDFKILLKNFNINKNNFNKIIC